MFISISLSLWVLSIISLAQAFHWTGNTMYDLELQGTAFDGEASSWSSSSGLITLGARTTICGSNSVLGGYNIQASSGSTYWYKTYSGLPSHNTIYFTGKFYMIDQWALTDDHFHIFFDSIDTIMWWIYSNYAYATSNQWGNPSYNDLDPMTISFTVPHTSTSLAFRMQNHFPKAAAQQSVGFRDITMRFATETTVPSFYYCGITTGFPLPNNPCPCPAGVTMVPANSGICSITCDTSCKTCNAVGRTACTSCQSPLVLAGSSCCDATCKTCSGTGPSDCASCEDGRYFSGGSCLQCDPSCKTCNGAGPSACTACDSPKFLTGGACVGCDSSCLTCTSAGPTTCATCSSKKFLAGTSCQNCDALCAECSGTSSFCTSCVAGYYNYWNGSCINNCPSPLSKSTVGGLDYCDFPCAVTSDYLYWDGTCSSSCPSSYISEAQGSRKFCWFPCQSNQFMYWNGSCLAQCLYPLKQTTDSTGAKFCSNPCGTPSDYLYSNQTCKSTCPSPLSVVINPGVQYCGSPCSSTSFLYENKTCLGNCLSPFVKRFEPDAQFCDRPCNPGIFWFKNASCLASCPEPYVKIVYSGILQCLPPCKDSEFFYEYEKECASQCESPFKMKYSDVIKICYNEIPLSLAETTKIQGAAASIQSQGSMASGGMKAAGAMNSGSPGSALLAGLSSMLQYIRYMKINYPPKVQMLFLVSAGSPISLGFDFDIPESVAKKLDDNRLPDVFEKYDINSNFVNNLWDFLMTLLMILVVIGALALIKYLVPKKRYPRIHLVFSKVLGAMKWNVPIMMVCSSSGDIFFFASLQIRSGSFDSFASIICFIVSLLMMIVVFLILVIGFKILQNFKRQAANPNWAEKWKGYEILYEEYEEKSIWSLSYMILFIIRGIIFNFTVANLFDFPLIQCIIINISNVLMFSYLLYLRPLKNFLGLVQLFVNEGLVNIIGVSIIILAIMDKAGINGKTTRVSVGDAIYFVIKVFNTFGLVFLGLSLLVFLVSLYKIWRQMKARKITSPLEIFKVMVFGEVTEEKEMNLPNEPSKRARIRKPPRKRSLQHTTTNQAQGNEVLYIEETEMSRAQMFTDISQTDILSVSAHFQPTPGNMHAMMMRTEEDVSERQMGGEFEAREMSYPSFRAHEDISQKEQVGASEVGKVAENPQGFRDFFRKLRGRIQNRGKSKEAIQIEKSEVTEERIETAASDIQIIEMQNVSISSSGFLQNWGRFKGRMKARGAANISICQDERIDTGASEREGIANSQNPKPQNDSVDFIQSWKKLKERLKGRESTNMSIHRGASIEVEAKEEGKKEEIETDLEVAEVTGSLQEQRNKSPIQSLRKSRSQIKAREQLDKEKSQITQKKIIKGETEVTEKTAETLQNGGWIRDWGNLQSRMNQKETGQENSLLRKEIRKLESRRKDNSRINNFLDNEKIGE